MGNLGKQRQMKIKKKYNQDILRFGKVIYRVLYERSYTTASFAEHPEFPGKMSF